MPEVIWYFFKKNQTELNFEAGKLETDFKMTFAEVLEEGNVSVS